MTNQTLTSFQPESIASLMSKDAALVRASYRELAQRYESMADELDRAEKRALQFQRRNQDLEDAVVNADRKASALSESAAELEEAKRKVASLQSNVTPADFDMHSIVEWKETRSRITRLKAYLSTTYFDKAAQTERDQAESYVADLESSIVSKHPELDFVLELRQAEEKIAALESALGGKELALREKQSALTKKDFNLRLCQSVLRATQPFLQGKQLEYQNGMVTQSNSQSSSTLQHIASSTPEGVVLHQPRIAPPRGSYAHLPDTWEPLPRHWMSADQQERFAEELKLLEALAPTVEENKTS